MTSFRTPWWAAAVLSLPLALAAGCGATEDATPTPTPTPTDATAAPVMPTEKPAMKAETEPAKAAPEPTKLEVPKVEAPKVEAPAVLPAPVPAKEAPKGASNVKLTDEEVAEIKKLPAGEQVQALKQAVCPVSGEHLGEMGTPIKVTAEGKAFFLCCKSCKADVEKDPKAVLAKLPK